MSSKKPRIFQNILKIFSGLPSQPKKNKKFFGNSLILWWKISTFLTIMESCQGTAGRQYN
jgi:hypothetical protein